MMMTPTSHTLYHQGRTLTAGLALVLASCQTAPTLQPDNIDTILGEMTTEEKIMLVVGAGNEEFTGYGNTKKIVPGAAGTTAPIPRLGITPTVLTDGPAGLRIDTLREGDSRRYYHTGFPIGTALACTWNTDLMQQVGEAIGNEAHEYGLDLIFAPGMNLHRDPLGGRNFEYYSEDPLLTGKMAAAFVKGIQANGVGATLKHYAVNNQETNRKDVDIRIAQRPLRELYLRGFEIAVREAQPWSVMSAYNSINGQQCMESRDLLTTILRRDWGFDGMVVSDWAAPGWRDSGKEIWAGNDLLAPGSEEQRQEIAQALKDGKLSEADLDTCVRRMLRFVTRTPRFQQYAFSNAPDLKAHARRSLEAAEEGIVLLENRNQTLPLASSVKRVGMFGIASYNFLAVGTGSGNVKTPHTKNLEEGFALVGIQTNAKVAERYRKVIADSLARRSNDPLGYEAMPEIAIDDADITASAEVDDAAIITIGRSCGEGADRRADTQYRLSQLETEVVEKVCNAFHAKHKPVVVVLNVSGVVEVASWRTQPDAVVLSWLLGQEGGEAVCRMLKGEVCPSGRLSMTFPVAYEDCNTHDNFPYDFHGPKAIGNYTKIPRNPAIKNVHYTDYKEGIYVGYRYFDTYGRSVSYPFGYGLSYTQFGYTDAQCKTLPEGGYEVSVRVTNTGRCAGKEVVQLYAPVRDLKHQLIGFGKTRTLKPGEAETLRIRFTPRDLSYFDEAQNAWVLAAGDYRIEVAAHSRDAKAHTTLHVEADKILDKVAGKL